MFQKTTGHRMGRVLRKTAGCRRSKTFRMPLKPQNRKRIMNQCLHTVIIGTPLDGMKVIP